MMSPCLCTGSEAPERDLLCSEFGSFSFFEVLGAHRAPRGDAPLSPPHPVASGRDGAAPSWLRYPPRAPAAGGRESPDSRRVAGKHAGEWRVLSPQFYAISEFSSGLCGSVDLQLGLQSSPQVRAFCQCVCCPFFQQLGGLDVHPGWRGLKVKFGFQ